MTPGHRYRRMGPYSGEEFYETLLKPKLEEAIRKNKRLILDMDGTEGLSGGFRDEVFLRVGADFGDKLPFLHLVFKQDEVRAVARLTRRLD